MPLDLKDREQDIEPDDSSNDANEEELKKFDEFRRRYEQYYDDYEEFMDSRPGQFLAYGGRAAKIAYESGGGKKGIVRGLVGGVASNRTLLLLSILPQIIIVLGVLILIYLVGPLQFVQAAQMLEKYHFGAVNSFADGRTAKLFRYYFWQDKPQNRRLTLAANELTDRIDALYKRAGMEVGFDADGRMTSIKVDTENKRFRADNFDELFRDKDFNVTRDGKFAIITDSSGGNFAGRKGRKLFNQTRLSLGLGGFGGWVQARLPLNRINPSMLHPIRKLDEITLENAQKARQAWAERKEKITGSSEEPSIRGSPDANDEDGNPKPNVSDDVASSVDDIGNVGIDLEGEPKVNAAKENIKVKTGAGKALGVAGAVNAVTGITCLVYTMANIAGDLEFQNVSEPSMRHGGYRIGLGNQVKNREDLQAQQLKFENESMYDESNDGDPNTKPSSWFDNKGLQIEGGRDPTGPDTPNSAKIGGSINVLTQLTNAIPDLGQWLLSGGCGAVNSPVGQVFTFSIDLFLAPASAVSGFGTSLLVGPLLDDLARYIAGEQISEDLAGAALGGVDNQGAFMLANEQFATNGGVPLSEEDRTSLSSMVKAEQKYATQNQSFSERYFSLTNPDSLFATIGRTRIPSPNGFMTGILNTSKNFSFVTRTFTRPARAAVQPNYDYGVPKVGYTPAELNLLDNDESYANPFQNEAVIAAKIPEMHKQYSEKCFGIKFDEQEHFTMSKPADLKKLATDPAYSDCRRTDAEYLHYRTYVGDLMNTVSVSCWLGDEAACTEIGSATDSSQDPSSVAPSGGGTGFKGQDTSGLTCKVGKDAGIGPTPDPGKKIRLCNVGGVIVNVAIEQNVKTILDGTASAGITGVGGWGYRSNATQIELRKAHCGTSQYDIYQKPSKQCHPPTARPGNSMHEWGLAVDFTMNGSIIQKSSPLFTWLSTNQGLHQLRNLPSEAWHWSSTGN